MKNFSTAVVSLVFATACAALVSPAAVAAAKCEFKPDAPDSHKVVRGDTLWDISGKFLQHPWCWPQVWGLNRDQIKNPHWIYPGQIVYFDRTTGRLSLGKPVGAGGTGGTVRLSPQVRVEGMGQDAVPAIPSGAIEPFLSQPLIVTAEQLQGTPRIVASQEGRVSLAKNDRAYVSGDLKGGTSFQAFRPGKPLLDPDTKQVIGYEAAYLGTLKLTRAAKEANEAHSFMVVSSKEEMGVGDRLLPVPPTPMLNYVPHAPEQQVAARIVSVYGGVTHAGQNQIVSINRGAKDGVDLGTVLELYRHGGLIRDRTDTKEMIKLPDEKYGALFVFRIFDNISYALIMHVADTVQVGDVARSPE
ncbi:LysM peptidoglycan-binding domain-containing protein [Noviherbaspirillum sedimenti]|uniref:LysM peptidoglycan-binding domain-containing protein n=1 Tax=Noviherbaspirillum sedimenti TaxID=2320865 RepID=A0A3A3GP76_9BURK|nr:LysM peptidoglycan-binding domain-containing protein [Noviherbaspirillum sedimenti]RJG02780.1 LysM peptidoglycan-binding domain-containing protein [Noviherbaspirillum sedimenti]